MQGFQWRPSGVELRDGKRPPEGGARDPGEWPHGWQYWASSTLVSGSCPCLLAKVLLVRPISGLILGHNSGCALSHAPTTPEFTIQPHLFQVLLHERLRLPLFLTESTCSGCHEPLDPLGHHRAACSHSGRIQRRAIPIERVMARICREAGARVKFSALLRDANVRVASSDARQIEVLAQDLPCFGGSQLQLM